MALGEHLRADQDARLAAVHPLEHGLHRRRAAGRVAIEPRERRVGEQPRQRFLDPLGSLADRVEAAAGSLRRSTGTGASAPQ